MTPQRYPELKRVVASHSPALTEDGHLAEDPCANPNDQAWRIRLV